MKHSVDQARPLDNISERPANAPTVHDSTPIDKMEFSKRGYGVCRRLGIDTVAHLCQHTAKELQAAGNCGRRTIADIRECLAYYGRRLKNDPATIPEWIQQSAAVIGGLASLGQKR